MTDKKPGVRQGKALMALLDGRTVAQAADAAGCSERQLYRWLRDAEFNAALHQAQAAAIQSSGRRLAALTDTAVEALEAVLTTPDMAGASTLRLAARDVLELARAWWEAGQLDERVTALELQLRGRR